MTARPRIPRSHVSRPRVSRPRRVLALLLAPWLLASTCYSLIDLGLEQGPAPEAPVFVATRKGAPVAGLSELEVYACRPWQLAQPMWRIVRVDGESFRAPLRITYGTVPDGYREDRPAQPLARGRCYAATAAGADTSAESVRPARGAIEFQVDSGGWARKRSTGIFSGSREARQVDRAVRGCALAYRALPTAADSGVVHAREFPVADTVVSCRTLASLMPREMAHPPPSTGRRVLEISAGIATLIGIFVAEDAIRRSID